MLKTPPSESLRHAVSTRITLCAGQPHPDVEVTLHDKPADDWPEAGRLWVSANVSQPCFRPGGVALAYVVWGGLLAARTLREGQPDVVFAGALWLLVPLVLGSTAYGHLQWRFAGVPHLHRMLWTLLLLLGVMALVTIMRPLTSPKELPVRKEMDVRTEPIVFVCGGIVMAAVVAFFLVFR